MRIFIFFCALFMILAAGAGSPTTSLISKPDHKTAAVRFDEGVTVINSDAASKAMLGQFNSISMDSRQNIYIPDAKQAGILKFDKSGSFAGLIGGLKGGGPGDLVTPARIYIDYRDHIFIYDTGHINISQFDDSGTFVHSRRIDRFMSSNFFIDKAGNVYGFIKDMTLEAVIQKLVKYSPRGKQLETIAAFKDSGHKIRRTAKGGWLTATLTHVYSRRVCLVPVDQHTFCYGFNLENRLFLYDTGENKGTTFEFHFKKEEITSAEQDLLKKRYGQAAFLPGHRPFFKKILCDQKGRIYIFRVMPVLEKSPGVRVYVFNKKGEYLFNFLSEVDPVLIRDGYFYTKEEDESENYIVKKYKMRY